MMCRKRICVLPGRNFNRALELHFNVLACLSNCVIRAWVGGRGPRENLCVSRCELLKWLRGILVLRGFDPYSTR